MWKTFCWPNTYRNIATVDFFKVFTVQLYICEMIKMQQFSVTKQTKVVIVGCRGVMDKLVELKNFFWGFNLLSKFKIFKVI